MENHCTAMQIANEVIHFSWLVHCFYSASDCSFVSAIFCTSILN
jgi:hypothetical protein